MADIIRVGKTYHHGNLREVLIQASIAILRSQGGGGLTLRAVAGLAGVSQTSVYRHFTDKQDLLAAIAERGFRLMHTYINEAIELHIGDSAREFRAAGEAYFHFAVDEKECYKLMFSSSCPFDQEKFPDLHTAGAMAFAQLVGLVAKCQQSGLFRAGHPQFMALQVWSAVHGLAMLQIEGQLNCVNVPEVSFENLSNDLFDTLVKGLG